MFNIFNIIRPNRFLSLYIIRHISIVKSRKKLVVVAIIWFESIVLSKVVRIFNSRIEIEINLIIDLTF